MSDWRLASSSSDYKSALKETDSLDPPSVGFVKLTEDCPNSATALSALLKQNNTIIQLLLIATERIRDLEEKVERIQSIPKSTTESFETSLSTLQN